MSEQSLEPKPGLGVRLWRHVKRNFLGYTALVVAVSMTPLPAYAAGKIGTKQIKNGAITTAKIRDGAVTTPKLANAAVTSAKIANGSVAAADLAAGAAYRNLCSRSSPRPA